MKCHVVRICLDNSLAWAERMGLTARNSTAIMKTAIRCRAIQQ